MKQHCLDHAIPTSQLLVVLEEPKFSVMDALASTAQVAAALGLCWMVHLIA